MDFSRLSGSVRMPQEPSMPVGDAPPTPEDHAQAITHHLSSVTYNAKHAAAHQTETAKHSQALLSLLKKVPGFARHAKKV